jgi:hypothetical protein
LELNAATATIQYESQASKLKFKQIILTTFEMQMPWSVTDRPFSSSTTREKERMFHED